jgi:hypothetical protein
MGENEKLKFYFDPGDTETNDSLYLTLTAKGLSMETVSKFYKGEQILVFPVTRKFVKYVRNADISFPYDAKIYTEDESGTVRLWKLHKRLVRKRAITRRRSRMVKTAA